MSEDLFIRHCSPTLAGIKTGSMFPCTYHSGKELTDYIRQANRVLVPKGLRVLPLRHENGHALIYIFRPKALAQVLKNDTALQVLEKCGYKDIRVEPCVCQLVNRFQFSHEFPHEVGLFLGYPPVDVRGFIENKACGQKCVGCWKVYGDEDSAKKTFALYKKCTAVYCTQWKKGKSIEQLTVAG